MSKYLKRIYHFLIAYFTYWYYGRPSRHLIVVGVTGTKGKSTTCKLIHSVLQAGGFKTCLMSTVEYRIGNEAIENKNKMTMLGRGQIHKFLQSAVAQGCQYAVIETSSEGIMQYRHLGLNYDIAVFTNLGTEHSERHGGFANLKKDKGKLFSALQHKKYLHGKLIPKIIVANGDDANADYYLSFPADQKWICGLSEQISGEFAIRATDIQVDSTQTSFIAGRNYVLNIIGKFNVYNALLAIAVGKSQQIPEEKISTGLSAVKLVEGRMEFIEEGQDFKVIVDYAHEPLSYTELFTTLRGLLVDDGKLIALIGSDGGGRDKSKRAKMGQIAGELTDVVIVTDVNCFDEDPHEIAEMLAIGARQGGKKDGVDLFIEVDRYQAILSACKQAQKNDIVVITAKGTEPCIMVANGEKIPWDDRVEARRAVKEIEGNKK